jgi:hypothetical protein
MTFSRILLLKDSTVQPLYYPLALFIPPTHAIIHMQLNYIYQARPTFYKNKINDDFVNSLSS